ncbi:MAG: hypothetical protein GF381_01165 [Candidatus Pacebacteria bacterium]|nr:hypothetical protein [Candidatus Paceibacterota bacterium]
MKKIWQKHHLKIISLGLFLLAATLRLPKLNSLPAGFFPDEAALAYNGWSIWRTSRDEWGQQLPLTMRSFDDDKPALYAYLTIPFVLLDGLTHAAARYPAALAGSILPTLVFWLAVQVKQKRLGLLAALVIIITPWHWEVARTAIEAGVALTFSVGALVAFKSKWSYGWWVGLALSLLTIFTYHTARLILPWLLILTALLLIKRKKRRKLVVIFGGLLFAFGLTLSLTASSERFAQISIFNDRGALALRQEAIREDGVAQIPIWMTRMFHNKPLSWLQTFSHSYLKQNSLIYLFWGGAQPPRVEIPETGQFLLVLLPFFILGLVKAVRRQQNFDWWLLAWLLLAPLPASLTSAEIPHTYRTLFMLIPVALLIAQGLETSLGWVWHQLGLKGVVIISSVISALVLANTAKAWHQYAIHQQLNKPWHRQYGYQELYQILSQYQPEQDHKVYITQTEKEPYIYALYYNQVPPEVYQAQPEKRLAHKAIEAGEASWQLFNYVFTEDACPYDYGAQRNQDLYVVNKTCTPPAGFKRRCKISFQDDSAMFFIDSPTGDRIEGEEVIDTLKCEN